MLIDWFTVVAQVCNFLILVWLMKRYLYRPILAAIDTREKKIASGLKEAKEKMAEAEKRRDEFQKKNDAFEQDRGALLQGAEAEGKVRRQQLLDQARADAQVLRTKLEAAVQSERDNLKQEIRSSVQQEVFAISRKALADLATADIETQMAGILIARLHAMDASAKTALENALKNSADPVQVRSTFALPDAQREAIVQALKENFGTDKKINFTTSPAPIAGIELLAGGQKLSWSIDDYLTSLEKRVDVLLAPAAAGTDQSVAASSQPGDHAS